jgi:alpha-L-rhamnosidase
MLFVFLAFGLGPNAALLGAAPARMRVEGLLEPVAVISEPLPRFSFLHGELSAGSGFGITQTSYRITVSNLDGGGALVWDSGVVKTANCSQIEYAGKSLAPFTRYAWTAEWTSSAGVTSAQAISHFETGLLAASDWHGAKWFVPTGVANKTLFRAEFSLPTGETPSYARAFVAATGCAHIEVNGRVPEPNLLGICPWAIGANTVRYVTHDITPLLTPGGRKFAVGLIAGHVMAGIGALRGGGPPVQMAALFVVKYPGNSEPVFYSSSPAEKGWLVGDSYVTADSAWATAIDWTKQHKGWSTVGFHPDASWVTPTALTTAVPARALAMPLSTILGEIKPTAVRKLPDGDFLYTFPKNFVGTIKLAPLPTAANGSSVNIRLGEFLKAGPEPSQPDVPSISHASQTENHTLRAGNADPITTLFCWHGFQFVRVSSVGDTGFEGGLDSIVGLVINTNVTQTGVLSFGGGGDPVAEYAAALLDGVNQMTLQSQRTNIAAYMPTDCPTREKHGWMGDALDASEQALYNFEMGPIHHAFLQLIADNQGANGDVPAVIPRNKPRGNSCNDIAWTTAYPQIMEMQYEYRGDKRVVARKWDSLASYQENLIAHATTSNNTHEGLAVCDTYKGEWHCVFEWLLVLFELYNISLFRIGSYLSSALYYVYTKIGSVGPV